MSTERTVLSTWKRDQASPPTECCSVANRRAITSARACPFSRTSHATDPVGRLESLPNTTEADASFADTNGLDHAHTSPSTRCSRAWPFHTAGTQALSADMGATSGTQCQSCTRASCEASPVRHSDGLRPVHRPSLRRVGIGLCSPVSSSSHWCGEYVLLCFFLLLCKRFFYSILFHPVIKERSFLLLMSLFRNISVK